MQLINALTAASVGVGLATVGTFRVPAEPARAETDRALLRLAVAAAGACAWALWQSQAFATMLPFVVATLLLGGADALDAHVVGGAGETCRLPAPGQPSSSSSPSRGSRR